MYDYNWDISLKRMRRRSAAHRFVCYAFIAAIAVLYIANFTMRAFVYHDTLVELLRDFVCPVAIVAAVYALDWKNGYTTKFICNQLPAVPLTALAGPVVAAFFACLSYEPYRDTVDYNITILASLAMVMAPYAFRNVPKACCAIVMEAIGFVFLAARLGHNVSAMQTILWVAAMLILALPKLEWFNGDEAFIKEKTYIALVMLICAAFTLVFIEDTRVMESIVICSFGRPGLHSSAAVNQACSDMIINAKWVGRTECMYPMESIFANRVCTYILGAVGWVGVVPILLAEVVMIVSGIYILKRSIRVSHYLAVSYLTLISVQTFGYLFACFGWDELLFPEMCPFLDGGIFLNAVYLYMATKILPPKQKKLLDDEEMDKLIDEIIAEMAQEEGDFINDVIEEV